MHSETYTRKPGMYNETHQIQITLITKCGLYDHALFAYCIWVPISAYPLELECYTDKFRMYDETHKILIALITECCLYAHGSLFTLLYWSINISKYIRKPIELEWYTRKPMMYDETHKIYIALITKCGLYAHDSLFGLLYLGVNISRRT